MSNRSFYGLTALCVFALFMALLTFYLTWMHLNDPGISVAVKIVLMAFCLLHIPLQTIMWRCFYSVYLSMKDRGEL